MEKLTSKYETIFIVNATLADDQIAAIVEKFRALVEANATIEKVEDWGKRRLAYPINDMPEGYYTVVTFKSAPEFPSELDRLFNIDETVMRSMTIRLEYDAAEKKAAKIADEAAKVEAAEEAPAEAEAPAADAE